MLRLSILILLLSGCASGQIERLVKVRDAAQEGITDIQTFCAEIYPELLDREKLQKKVGGFCDRMDAVFDRIQVIYD
jgi:hypothetical protein